MLVELHIRRTRNGIGSTINMPGATYEFKPRKGSGDAHVCDVTDEKHIARFLSIREYTEFGEAMAEIVTLPEPVLEEIPDEPSEEDELQEEADLDIEMQMCETVIGMIVSDAKAELGGLSDSSLAQLAVMERAGQARSTLLAAIVEEQDLRQEDDDPEE